MKRQISRVTASSMNDRRIDSGLFARHAVKNVLSSVRGLYSKLRREVTHGNDKTEGQNCVNEMGRKLTRMHMDQEELWNLRNENLENELKEMAMKMKN